MALVIVLLLLVESLRLTPEPPALTIYPHDAPARLDTLADLETSVPVEAARLLVELPASDAAPLEPALALTEEAPGSEALFSDQIPSASKLLLAASSVGGGGLEGRDPARQAELVRQQGGSDKSQEAVRRGLRWLAAHQSRDGGWRFDHRSDLCQGLCRNHGTVTSTTGATALALLPFLGAGQTHIAGEHQDVVRSGLYYLTGRMLATPGGGDFQEGTMYAQGLAAMALCEAYAMTRDANLKGYAQQSLNFIVYAQDKNGGGWRYSPGQPGDTTVTGWQLLALKSGRLAGLHVPTLAIADAQRFLDSVQAKSGAEYGYRGPQSEPTTTSVGLLCRMVTGWQREHPPLSKGIEYLDREGPSKDNMYYNYYATQVLHHWGGYPWERWNAVMRDYLITSQAQQGHESGSWYFSGGHAESGGRLYNTAMAVMTLEVYYRYLPLYQTERIENEF